MQNDSNVEKPQAEIPAYLQCKPRTYKVKLNHWHEDTCNLEFTVVIKCIDAELHEHNNFWSNNESRLEDNEGNIVAVILKMIGRTVFWWCYENNSNSLHEKYGVNSIFNQEGWNPKSFEITHLYFENNVRDEDFEFEPVVVEG